MELSYYNALRVEYLSREVEMLTEMIPCCHGAQVVLNIVGGIGSVIVTTS